MLYALLDEESDSSTVNQLRNFLKIWGSKIKLVIQQLFKLRYLLVSDFAED